MGLGSMPCRGRLGLGLGAEHRKAGWGFDRNELYGGGGGGWLGCALHKTSFWMKMMMVICWANTFDLHFWLG